MGGFGHRIIPLAFALSAGACSGGDGGGTMETLPEWTVGQTPAVSIGGVDDRPDYLVYGVVGATRLSDGRIAVALQRSSEVKYFDPRGRHLKTAGGDGDGPGEFRAPTALLPWPVGDTMGVWDARQRRVTLFDSAGNPGRSFPTTEGAG